MLMQLIVIVLCAFWRFGTEASARFRVDTMELLYADSEYYDLANTEITLVDREAGPSEMENAMNSKIQLIKQIPENTTAHIIVSGWSEGEYKKPTGINVTVNVCDLLKERFIMGPLLSAMGFNREECPPGPGNYAQEGYFLRNNTVPEIVPRNKYQTDFEIFTEEKSIFLTRTILEVYD